jgi:hypothetical protein
VQYLTAWRIGIGTILAVVLALALINADLGLVVMVVLAAAAVLTVALWPRAPWWGDKPMSLFRDQERMRRETRRDVAFFGVVLYIAAVAGAVRGVM